jgi:predicted NBD/HSP70 family sugar kinase
VSIINRTAEIICNLIENRKIMGKKVLGVGLAVPGLINRSDNIIEISPDLRWEYVDLIKILREKCDLPIKFDNVTRVMALGELWYGVGKTVKHFSVVNIGYGIGAGIIIDGKPLYGPYGMAGEFGHMTMEKDSEIQCACGNFGCLEALASGHAIADRAIHDLKTGRTSILKNLINGDLSCIDTKLVAEAARKGDTLAQEIFGEAVDYIGTAIASMINLISPQVVLIGGGVSQAEDLIFDQVKRIIAERTIQTRSRKVDIRPVTFSQKAATKGAVALILNEALNLNIIDKMSIRAAS